MRTGQPCSEFVYRAPGSGRHGTKDVTNRQSSPVHASRWVLSHPPAPCRSTRIPDGIGTPQGHFTSGGSDDRIASTLPPVMSPNLVPRS